MVDVELHRHDLVLTDDGDLSPIRGEGQTMEMLCNTEKGEWKMSPTDGLGIANYCGAPANELQDLKRLTIEAMKRNKINGDVSVEDNQLNIKVNYDNK